MELNLYQNLPALLHGYYLLHLIAFLWQVWRTMICVKWYAIEIIHFLQPTYCTPFVAENASKLGASKLLHGINKQQDDGLLSTINSS